MIKSRRMRWMGHVACIGEMRNVYRMHFRKPEHKGLLGRHEHTWKDDIKMYHAEIG
jgi:hypothetical protein